jgi:hypothetical protein
MVTLAEHGDDVLAAELGDTWISEPVGSITWTSASAPSSAMTKCSGRCRRPRPAVGMPGAAPSGRRMPFAAVTSAPFS